MKEYIGKICPFCKTEIKEGDAVKVCPSCDIPHHEACWEENKGCTTFGCSEQHHEEQHTNRANVCVKCGAPLGEEQDFCPKCGAPKKIEENKKIICGKCGAELIEGQEFCTKCGTPVTNKPICSKCGAELVEGQEFCSKCGQKVGLEIDHQVSSAIDQFNAGVGEKKKKKKIKLILGISIPVAVIAVVLVMVFLFSGSFKGKYNYVGGDSGSSYTFEDDYYIYKTSDDSERGKYKVDNNQVTLTDDDGDDSVFYIDGKYIFGSKSCYDQKIQDGSTVNKTFSKSVSTEYKGYTLSINQDLSLKSDGTYKYTVGMTYIGDTIGDDVNEDGEYQISGNKLILSAKGENFTRTFIIKDGKIYTDVFMKE